MRVHIATPASGAGPTGNRVSARRWRRILRDLGHRVTVSDRDAVPPCDVLIALHAMKRASVVRRFHEAHPDRPVILALTGTDLYGPLTGSAPAMRSLRVATRLVLLQPEAVAALPPAFRPKSTVILQSATPVQRRPVQRTFRVCVIAHLRPVKDPFRAAYAVRRLPAQSRIEVVHIGAAMTPGAATQAAAESSRNPRYRWLRSRPHGEAKRILASSHVLVLSSRSEGGANVISEAIVSSVPVIASRIAGSVGMLGARYDGYFRTGDTAGLARLLARVEEDRAFHGRLRAAVDRRAPLFHPDGEREAWRRLLRALPHAGDRGASP